MHKAKSNPELAQKIANLQLHLHPLVPLPQGEAHPAFPRTLLAYHLLTEEELDDIAHHYHQSTPSFWTNQYPANMNWDKEWLNASKQRRRSSLTSLSRRPSQNQSVDQTQDESNDWFTQLINNSATSQNNEAETPTVASSSRRRSSSAKPSRGLTDAERIAIKRRKVGKFIGLIGMDSPASEIEGRLREAMERVIQAGQDELRNVEEYYLRRRKIG